MATTALDSGTNTGTNIGIGTSITQALIDGGPLVILAFALLGAVLLAHRLLPSLVQVYVEKRRQQNIAAEIATEVTTPADTSKSQRTLLSEAWIARMEARAAEIHKANEDLQNLSLRIARAEKHVENLMGYWIEMRNKHEELRVQVADISGMVRETRAKVESCDEKIDRVEDAVTDSNRKLDRLMERLLNQTPPPRSRGNG